MVCNNYKWSRMFKNCESLYWHPVTYRILHSTYTVIKKKKKFKKRNTALPWLWRPYFCFPRPYALASPGSPASPSANWVPTLSPRASEGSSELGLCPSDRHILPGQPLGWLCPKLWVTLSILSSQTSTSPGLPMCPGVSTFTCRQVNTSFNTSCLPKLILWSSPVSTWLSTQLTGPKHRIVADCSSSLIFYI